MPMTIVHEPEELIKKAFDMSCDDQLALAQAVAANVGYKLVPEDSTYDELSTGERLERLEAAVMELNPGLGWR